MTAAATLPPEDAALAAEYAMGLLRGDDLSAFEARLRQDPVLLGEVQDWHEHLSKLTDGVEKRPPLGAKKRLKRRLFGAPVGLVRLWQGLASAGFAVAVVLAILLLGAPNQAPSDVLATEIVASDASLRLLAVFDGDTLRITRTEGEARAGRALELWLIAPEMDPISLGVLPETDITRRPVAEQLRPLFAMGTLAISDEPEGGSPTGQPTGEVLAVGQLTAL